MVFPPRDPKQVVAFGSNPDNPKFAVYWAHPYYFAFPGVYVWVFSRKFRLIPLPKSRRHP